MRSPWLDSMTLGVEQNAAGNVLLIDKQQQPRCTSLRNSKYLSMSSSRRGAYRAHCESIESASCKRLIARFATAAIVGVLGACFALNVNAESGGTDENAGASVEEIVITASKRVSTVQETPISIAAVIGDDLLARGVDSLASLAQGTPGVSLKSEGPSQTEIEMRGMTSSGGNSATVGF